MNDLFTGVLILVGVFFVLSGSLGLLRFPDFYSRAHGPTKATTLGVSSIVLATISFFSEKSNPFIVTECLIIFFLFLTAPASAHMLAKAAQSANEETIKETKKFQAK